MFFAKKTKVKCQSDPEFMNSSKQDLAFDNLKKECDAEDTEGKVEEETKDHIEPEMHGIKREFGKWKPVLG